MIDVQLTKPDEAEVEAAKTEVKVKAKKRGKYWREEDEALEVAARPLHVVKIYPGDKMLWVRKEEEPKKVESNGIVAVDGFKKEEPKVWYEFEIVQNKR